MTQSRNWRLPIYVANRGRARIAVPTRGRRALSHAACAGSPIRRPVRGGQYGEHATGDHDESSSQHRFHEYTSASARPYSTGDRAAGDDLVHHALVRPSGRLALEIVPEVPAGEECT